MSFYRPLLNRLKCFYKGHSLVTLAKISDKVSKVECTTCSRVFCRSSHFSDMIDWGSDCEAFAINVKMLQEFCDGN